MFESEIAKIAAKRSLFLDWRKVFTRPVIRFCISDLRAVETVCYTRKGKDRITPKRSYFD